MDMDYGFNTAVKCIGTTGRTQRDLPYLLEACTRFGRKLDGRILRRGPGSAEIFARNRLCRILNLDDQALSKNLKCLFDLI
jgi:hypothetical protein